VLIPPCPGGELFIELRHFLMYLIIDLVGDPQALAEFRGVLFHGDAFHRVGDLPGVG
jgi:hypothetical protein